MDKIKTIKTIINGKEFVFHCKQYNDTFKSNDIMNGKKCLVHKCNLQLGTNLIGVGENIYFGKPCETEEYQNVMYSAVRNSYAEKYYSLLKEFLRGRKHTRKLESDFYNNIWINTNEGKELEEFKKYFGIR